MNQRRKEVLEMLAAGKITADEAERLISALERGSSNPQSAETSGAPLKATPRYLRVLVDAGPGGDGKTPKVNVRVPMQLLRAGVKLASLIPQQAQAHVNDALREKGLAVDLSQLKPENLEALIDGLSEMRIDVDDKDAKVAVFCE
jgi:hypothetical protein